MKVSELKYEDLTDGYVDKILFENIKDDGESGDCILVFGSIKANQYRVPKAVELYKQNRASKIIFSDGKGIETTEGYMLEAEMMQKKAIE
ncbi:MAG: ElyC/SanA/YdcF family protein, partial [Niameybacter sp.]|uniref:ElyC/SanA/YdcF family protein n=1 Tax=Niameybacter sp. TaxID=2033640 RepID=UPI002FC8DF84